MATRKRQRKSPRPRPSPRRDYYLERIQATSETDDTLGRAIPRYDSTIPPARFEGTQEPAAPATPQAKQFASLLHEWPWLGIISVVGFILMVVGVYWYGHSLDKDVSIVNKNLEKLTDKVDLLSERTIRNSDRLENIEKGVSNLNTKLDKTKDLLNDIRAGQRGN